jgi:integrase
VNPRGPLSLTEGRCAQRDLRLDHAQVYLGLFLCLRAGLRRKEADLLLWEQIDFNEGCIPIYRTLFFEPKTEESQRTVDLAASALEVLSVFKKGSSSTFVLTGAEPNPLATYDYYRCDCTWRDLNAWLRGKGLPNERRFILCGRKAVRSLPRTMGYRQHAGISDIGISAPRLRTMWTKRSEWKLTYRWGEQLQGNCVPPNRPHLSPGQVIAR